MRYKVLDENGFLKNIILLENKDDYSLPEGYTLLEDDGEYIYPPEIKKEQILAQITLLESTITERRKNEAIIGIQESINFIQGVLDKIAELRQQLNELPKQAQELMGQINASKEE